MKNTKFIGNIEFNKSVEVKGHSRKGKRVNPFSRGGGATKQAGKDRKDYAPNTAKSIGTGIAAGLLTGAAVGLAIKKGRGRQLKNAKNLHHQAVAKRSDHIKDVLLGGKRLNKVKHKNLSDQMRSARITVKDIRSEIPYDRATTVISGLSGASLVNHIARNKEYKNKNKNK